LEWGLEYKKYSLEEYMSLVIELHDDLRTPKNSNFGCFYYDFEGPKSRLNAHWFLGCDGHRSKTTNEKMPLRLYPTVAYHVKLKTLQKPDCDVVALFNRRGPKCKVRNTIGET
jgi:hypothetical protein